MSCKVNDEWFERAYEEHYDELKAKGLSDEEIDKFINSLTNQQLEKITQFVQSVPTLYHEQKYICKKCGHENTLELKGLQDFF